ncbi:hypothetical protein BDR07DRAFT_1489755 [Suillus spraguei]|nr:hypothetical protein BDR07DRAFT_1489755 [Suillus spraguei]
MEDCHWIIAHSGFRGTLPALDPPRVYKRSQEAELIEQGGFEKEKMEVKAGAGMCGVGAIRRPMDPPPIIQTHKPSAARLDDDDSSPSYAHSFLQNLIASCTQHVYQGSALLLLE